MAQSRSKKEASGKRSRTIRNSVNIESSFGDFVREGPFRLTQGQHADQKAIRDAHAAEFEKTGSPRSAERMIAIGGRNARREKRGKVRTDR